MATLMLLVRHGDTAASKDERFTGAMDIPLSKEGRIHASELGTRLSRYPLDAIYASDLRRARETAEFVGRVHGLAVSPVPGLREMSHGAWEGLTRAEVRERFPPEQSAAYDGDPYRFAPQGGECGADVLARAVPALQEIVRRHDGQTVLVVAHKTTNRLLISRFLGLDPARYRDTLAQRPACLNVLRFGDGERAQLLLLNDVSHYAMSDATSYHNAV